MYKIGLTGGIGSGKTTIGQLFQSLGVEVFEADEIAHELIQPGTASYEKIVSRFGPTIVNKDKQIIRKKLREFIFNQSLDKKWLEELLHPQVIDTLEKRANASKGSYCVLIIPLLVEAQLQHLVDRILFVRAPDELRILRVQARDHTTVENTQKIMEAQIPPQDGQQYAHDTLWNTDSLEELKKNVQKLNKKYLELTKSLPLSSD